MVTGRPGSIGSGDDNFAWRALLRGEPAPDCRPCAKNRVHQSPRHRRRRAAAFSWAQYKAAAGFNPQ